MKLFSCLHMSHLFTASFSCCDKVSNMFQSCFNHFNPRGRSQIDIEIVSGRSQALLELKDLANAKLESGDAEVGF